MPSLLILIPLLTIVVLNLLKKAMARKAAPWAAGALFLLQIALAIGRSSSFWNIQLDPLRNYFIFRYLIDDVSYVMFLAIGIVGWVVLGAGCHAIANEKRRFNFINLLLFILIGMNAIVLVADLFSSYVFLEVTAVAAFILIAIQNERLALEGAFKYIILSAIASVMMLTSLALLLFVAGETSFVAIKAALAGSSGSLYVRLAMGLFICGLFIKGGLVPFHGWLPDAYSAAPTYVSVLLAGIVTKVSGVYVLIRLMISVFGFTPLVQNVLMAVGALSIIVGALATFVQSDFKRMLAYSSVSQVGYIVLALGAGTKLAVAAAVFHLFNHAIFKSLLFVNAAAVEERLGSTDMDYMGGLASRMPLTGATSVIGLLSTAGIPPLSGFWSKFIIILALWTSGNRAYAVIALLASILTLGYFLSMQRRVFFGKVVHKGLEDVREASFAYVFPAIVLAAIAVGVGLFFPWILNWFILPVQNVVR